MSSSGEEFVDLDQELSSCESTSSESSFKTKQIKNKIKRDLNINLKELDVKDGEDLPENGVYKVIGQVDEQPVLEKKANKFTEPWIANAHKFCAKMLDNSVNLLPLDELLKFGLKQEFVNKLNTYTNVCFPVQSSVLPILLNNKNVFLPARDVVICSPTGSGKTLCYVLPILNNIHFVEDASAVYALIIAPSASLAEQIFKEFEKFNVFNTKIVALYGNTSYFHERSLLFPNNSCISQAHLIIATPGRLLDHLMDNDGNFINLSMLRFLVIDEADKMQDTARIEWLDVIERLSFASIASTNNLSISSLTNNYKQNCHLQKILVSATLLLDVNKLYIWNLRCPQLFLATDKEVEEENKQEQQNGESDQMSILLPEQTSYRLSYLLHKLDSSNLFKLAELSSNLHRYRLLKLIKSFRNGKIRILIACDQFSRGVDVQDVDCVINYDVPINERIFIHRAGRTARAMKGGLLLSLFTKDEKMRLKRQLSGHNLWKNVEELNNYKVEDEEAIKQYKKALAQLESECLPKTFKIRRKRISGKDQ
uniref:ATP-dependent RNA helicase n=1 Tax=Meloidogyne floridensis TaxID=298350 RepID=A0A915NK51_9BILA